MIGLDTNALLRWIIDDPTAPDQVELVRNRLDAERGPFFVNQIVLAEIAWVLRKKAKQGRAEMEAILAILADAPNVRLQQPQAVVNALASFLSEPGGFADHLIGEVNRHAGCTTTLTFDDAPSKSPAFSSIA